MPTEEHKDFPYAKCVDCHAEALAFSLDRDGRCYWCNGSLERGGTR